MNRFVEQYPDADGGGSDSDESRETKPQKSLLSDLQALEAGRRLIEVASKHILSDEKLDRLRLLAETDKQAFFAELGLTHQQARQLFMDMGLPVEYPEIDADAYAKFDPDEPFGWMKLAGREPTERNTRLQAEPIEAFSRYVVRDNEEAQRVRDRDEYRVPRLVEALDELAVGAQDEGHWEEFDKLSRFLPLSRNIFPRQFPEAVQAVSFGTHPVTRGVASFSLPYLMGIRPKEAISIWQRLLNDKDDPRVVDAAVMTYDLQLRKEFRVGKPLSVRQRRALGKHVELAKMRLKLAGYPRSVDLDHDD